MSTKAKTKSTKAKMSKIVLKELYQGLQAEMKAKLVGVAQHIPHPTEKGDFTEGNWLQMLQNYLPKRYQAERALVVDCEGQCSQQIDIVIFDRQFSPFVLHLNSALLVPVEAVYAVFEVKQDLTGPHVKYAGNKVRSVRRLKRTSAPLFNLGNAGNPRKQFRILGGLLCSRSSLTPALGDTLKAALNKLMLSQKLELGCCLEAGVFEDGRHIEPVGSAEMLTQFPSLAWPDEITFLGNESNSLVVFLFTLLHRLQSLGTVPAIDFAEYRKHLLPH